MGSSEEIESWYHGTDYFFKHWQFPLPKVKTKDNLVRHSFLAFSEDQSIAQQSGAVAGGLCSVSLKPHTKVMDLRVETPDNKRCWSFIKSSEMGQKHVLLETYDLWLAGCSSGDVLRMMTRDASYIENLEEAQRIAKEDVSVSLQEKQQAYIDVHNFTRQWIETVIAAPNAIGYDAVICAEVDDRDPDSPTPSTNLYVFNKDVITAPQWITKPDGKKLLDRIMTLENAGLI